MTSPYKDIRSDFFKRYFECAKSYDDYLLESETAHAQRWRDFESKITLQPKQRAIVEAFKRKMPVLVMSGVWCGDCARQGPMLKAIEEASNGLISCRFIDNRANLELQDELRINGAEKVPVVVCFSEDFYEIERFGDRHLSVYRRKMETELGAACDPGIVTGQGSELPGSELEVELGEWVSYFERLQLMLRLAPALRRRYND